MGYYLMRLTRSSHVDVLVKSDNLPQADKDFHEWLKNDDECKVHELLNERDHDSISIERMFETIEEYNRSDELADFEIDMSPKQTEPRYDLYLIIDEEPCHFHRKVWQDITMESVLNILKEYDKQYILKKSAAQYNIMRDALKRNCDVLCYTCEKRED